MQKIFAEIQKWQSRSNELRTFIFFPENRLVSSIFCENHRPQSVTVDGWYDLLRPGTAHGMGESRGEIIGETGEKSQKLMDGREKTPPNQNEM